MIFIALHWIYIGITIVLGGLVVVELVNERRWHHQLAYALILLPLVLRILHIK